MKTETASDCVKHGVANCKKCEDAARKRRERAEGATAKRAAALQEEINAAEDIKAFWAINIKAADPEKLAAWREQAERVLDQLWFISQHVKGLYNVSEEDTDFYVSVEEGDQDLKAFIAKHGKFEPEAIFRQGQFWMNPNRLASYNRFNNPEAIFALFGIVTGIPIRYAQDWEDYMREYRLKSQPDTSSPVPVNCATCKKTTYVDSTTANAYSRSGTEYHCESCLSRATESLYDDWGRLKDSQ
jgi:hypothetical protein